MELAKRSIPEIDKPAGGEIPEGTFLPTIDYDMLFWIALQNAVQMPVFGRFSDSFISAVRIVTSLILPEWIDDQYRIETKEDSSAVGFLGAVVRLQHRRKFFDKKDKVDFVA